MLNSEKKPVIKQENASNKSRRRGGNRHFQNARRTVTTAKFKGKTNDLDGHIFDVGVANQSQLFSTTTKEVVEYAGRTLKESQDNQVAIEKVEDVTFDIPKNWAISTELDEEVVNIIYKIDLDGYIKRTGQYRQNKSYMYEIVFG